ncbi:PepSY domain-containing protein [Streptococcus gordonii]|uniref:PepSY domain-containing protein n=1 Tax=Streptococcus gordonii TaxID=1302 RepID=UPI001CC026BD|nr:PepSY domain-containing protein [Streptococcus gordonii]MBZ2132623.1 PepSY domain-containing protein [Streptococcus gordonii]MBZ2141030.1 PepSY domain-containing protein [Streptococcus gordonii]MBZ2143848.1 PepSY domain-containing protein [Streptococcus gordonii]MBZ2145781.1 PepSY domain-containing protein [Streptococcus gordonii]
MKKLKGILLTGLVLGILAGGATTVVSADSTKQASRIEAASLTLSDAKNIALQTAGSGKVVSVDLDGNKAGAVYYDVTVLDGFTEKEYKIDARTGSILKAKQENIDDNEDIQLTQTNAQLTFEDAERILQQKYAQARVYDEELDIKAGQLVYKLEALNGTQKIKMTIDANTGNILNEKVK